MAPTFWYTRQILRGLVLGESRTAPRGCGPQSACAHRPRCLLQQAHLATRDVGLDTHIREVLGLLKETPHKRSIPGGSQSLEVLLDGSV
jgi:hypothetical protein